MQNLHTWTMRLSKRLPLCCELHRHPAQDPRRAPALGARSGVDTRVYCYKRCGHAVRVYYTREAVDTDDADAVAGERSNDDVVSLLECLSGYLEVVSTGVMNVLRP